MKKSLMIAILLVATGLAGCSHDYYDRYRDDRGYSHRHDYEHHDRDNDGREYRR